MHFEPLIVSIVTGVIGLAVVAVLVSQNANTSNVITGAGTALSSVINAAVSPVSGTNSGLNNLFGSAAGSALGSLI